MTDLTQLTALRMVTDLAYQRDLAKLGPLLEQEARLRRQLQDLDTAEARGRAATAGLDVMRPLGADILWERWLARNRSDVNAQLARVMAEKEKQMSGLRRSFGRSQVASELASRAESEARRRRDQQAMIALQDRAGQR